MTIVTALACFEGAIVVGVLWAIFIADAAREAERTRAAFDFKVFDDPHDHFNDFA